jgi:uncharacterized protein YecT (DUF1311 family)
MILWSDSRVKFKCLAALILSVLSANAMASWCSTRQTQRDMDHCYKVTIESTKTQVGNSYTKLMNTPGLTDEQRGALENNQMQWWEGLKSACGSAECALNSLYERDRMLQAEIIKSAAQAVPVPVASCEDQWIVAFRKEVGEDAMISADQLSEWEGWCKEGKKP